MDRRFVCGWIDVDYYRILLKKPAPLPLASHQTSPLPRCGACCVAEL